jgi:osmotically-inducible protein OsmY
MPGNGRRRRLSSLSMAADRWATNTLSAAAFQLELGKSGAGGAWGRRATTVGNARAVAGFGRQGAQTPTNLRRTTMADRDSWMDDRDDFRRDWRLNEGRYGEGRYGEGRDERRDAGWRDREAQDRGDPRRRFDRFGDEGVRPMYGVYGVGAYAAASYDQQRLDDRRRGYGARGRDERVRDDRDRDGRWDEDRSWWDRTTDEVSSWFGDEDAARRRRMDEINDHRGRGPKGYKRSDARILEDVNDSLAEDAWLDASDIEVRVSDREVTLDGTVRSRGDKRRAEQLCDYVAGVTHVQNNLRVAQAGQRTSSADSSDLSIGTGPAGRA